MATVTKQNSQFIVFQHAPEVQVDQYNLSAQLDQVDHEHPEQRQKERTRSQAQTQNILNGGYIHFI